MKQTDLSLNLTTKRTCMREFLAQMGLVRPWWAEVELLAPYKPDGKNEPYASCSAVDAAHSLHAAVVHLKRPALSELDVSSSDDPKRYFWLFMDYHLVSPHK